MDSSQARVPSSITWRTRTFLLLTALLVGACDWLAPTPSPDSDAKRQASAPVARTPVAVESRDPEPDEQPLPAGHYRGVAGIRPLLEGACPERYQPVEGLCAHERLIAMQTPKDLSRSIAQYKAGMTPPIVADAPAPPPRDPGLMEPGALVRTGPAPAKPGQTTDAAGGQAGERGPANGLAELLAALNDKRAKNDGDEAAGAHVHGADSPRNFQTLHDRERVEEMDSQLRELGKHMDVLKAIQDATADGEVDPSELDTLLKPLEGTGSEALIKQLLNVYMSEGLEGVALPE